LNISDLSCIDSVIVTYILGPSTVHLSTHRITNTFLPNVC